MYPPKTITAIHTKVHAVMPGVQNGGVVGDKDHGYGYHLSPNRLKALGKTDDYSIIENLDKGAGIDLEAASALDLTPKTQADQKLIGDRLMAASKAKDPRLKALREWFGSTDGGKTVTGYSLFRARVATADSSHKWHTHLSIWRSLAFDEAALQGIVDVILGVPAKEAFLPAYVVTSPCYAVRESDGEWRLRPIGYPITTAVAVTAEFLTTDSDFRYPVPCLALKETP